MGMLWIEKQETICHPVFISMPIPLVGFQTKELVFIRLASKNCHQAVKPEGLVPF